MDLQIADHHVATGREASARWRGGQSLFTIAIGILAMLVAAVIFLPVAIMLAKTLFPGWIVNTQAFADTFSGTGLLAAVQNSVIIVIAVNLTAVPAGVLFAWLNFRTDARMGALASMLPILPLLLPSVAMTIGWVFLASDQSGFLTNAIVGALNAAGIAVTTLPVHIFTWSGLLFLYFLEIMPVVYVIVAAAYRSLDPSLEEAARINGSGVVKTFLTVSVPVVRHAIALSMVLATVMSIAIYSIPAIIGTPAKIPTVSVYLVRLLHGQYPPRFDQAAVLALGLFVVFGALWLIQQRLNAFGRHAQIGGQGIKSAVILLGNRMRLTARILMIGYICLACVLPLLALLLVTLQPYWTPDVNFSVLSLDNFRSLFENDQARAAIRNSVMLGIGSSLTTLLVAAVLMVYAVKVGGARGSALGILTKIPATMSHMVIAAGFLIAFGGVPLYLANTTVILWLAYLVLYMPQASIAAEAAARQIGPQLSEASRICGAGEGKTMRRIILPLMLPGLAAGWILIFAHIVGELTASVILAGPHNPVMGYLIMSIYESGTYSQLAALAMIIATISAVTAGIAMVVARPKFSNAKAT